MDSFEMAGVEAQAKAEWAKSAKIRQEFLSLENYVAFKKAEASGSFRFFSNV
ncbi:MAG: hypothetical protein HZA19_06915 [Nitrospirae bacterium]|nr:hypothetical protein [Nitrospirota bacterium]